MADLVVAEPMQSEAKHALVDRILSSQQFRRTVRLREFLHHVAERSIAEPGTPIPEREIGVTVFQRPADYDTANDNIVRVSAGDLRRRLEHYFLDEGLRETLVCEMPRGGYALAFRVRVAVDTPVPVASPAAPVQQPVEVAPLPETAPESALPAPEPVRTATGWRGWLLDRRTLALLALCFVLALGSGFALFRVSREPWQASAPLRAIWSPFLTTGAETELVLADSSLAQVKSVTGTNVALSDYLGYGYKALETDPRFDSSTRAALHVILSRNSGSIGDFRAAANIFALTTEHQQLVLGSAHDFTPDAIKGRNVILLGSSVSNPWVDLYRDQQTFLLEKNTPGSVVSIRNLDVQPGEQALYRVGGDMDGTSGFAVVSILPNIEPDKRVLILQGTDSQATFAASNFITSAAGARAIAERLGRSSLPSRVEILLSSSKLLATPLETRILAIHTHGT